jgi:hypothetical protein
VKPGDLVKCAGPCYSEPVNRQEPAEAIRYYTGFSTGDLGVIVDTAQIYYGSEGEARGASVTWFQVLTRGRTVWMAGSGVRAA